MWIVYTVMMIGTINAVVLESL